MKNRQIGEGKNFKDKQLYNEFIYSYQTIDKTIKDEEDTSETRSSAVDIKENSLKKTIRRKSLSLKIKDFFIKHIVDAIIGIVLAGFLGFIWNLSVSQETIKKDILHFYDEEKETNLVIKTNYEKITEIEKNFEIFKAEVNKDIGYIKQKIKL